MGAKKSAVLIVGKTTRRIRRPSDRARTMDLFAAQAAAALERIALQMKFKKHELQQKQKNFGLRS